MVALAYLGEGPSRSDVLPGKPEGVAGPASQSACDQKRGVTSGGNGC